MCRSGKLGQYIVDIAAKLLQPSLNFSWSDITESWDSLALEIGVCACGSAAIGPKMILGRVEPFTNCTCAFSLADRRAACLIARQIRGGELCIAFLGARSSLCAALAAGPPVALVFCALRCGRMGASALRTLPQKHLLNAAIDRSTRYN